MDTQVIDLLSKSFFSMNRTMPPLLISIGTIAVNFLLNCLVQDNGEAVALTTSVAMTVGAAVCLIVMFRGEKIVKLMPVCKSLAASAAAGAVAWFLTDLFVSMTDSKLMLIVKCCGIGVVFMIVFLIACFLLRLEIITKLFKREKP